MGPQPLIQDRIYVAGNPPGCASTFPFPQAFIAKLEAEKAEIANIVNKTRDELTAAKETAHTLQRQAIDVSLPLVD